MKRGRAVDVKTRLYFRTEVLLDALDVAVLLNNGGCRCCDANVRVDCK